jgi:hypothetical protein
MWRTQSPQKWSRIYRAKEESPNQNPSVRSRQTPQQLLHSTRPSIRLTSASKEIYRPTRRRSRHSPYFSLFSGTFPDRNLPSSAGFWKHEGSREGNFVKEWYSDCIFIQVIPIHTARAKYNMSSLVARMIVCVDAAMRLRGTIIC